jgi:hypothetical protein
MIFGIASYKTGDGWEYKRFIDFPWGLLSNLPSGWVPNCSSKKSNGRWSFTGALFSARSQYPSKSFMGQLLLASVIN